MRKFAIPLGILLFGLAVALHYAFTTNYLAVYDAARDYWLFNYYLTRTFWEPMSGVNALQNTALFSSYFPAVAARSLHLPAEPFFKAWIATGTALVPVMAYFVARRFQSRFYAVFASLFIMGWVCFYQGGSFARSNFAMIIYGGLILVLLSDWRSRHKYTVLVALAGLLPFAHYGAAIIAAVALGGVLLAAMVLRRRQTSIYVGSALLSIGIIGILWLGVTNHDVGKYINTIAAEATQLAESKIAGTDDGVLTAISSRDKITQAAFGVLNPDGDRSFTLNWWMLWFAWLTVTVMSYGSWVVFRGDYNLAYKWLAVMSYCALAITVIVPQVSRGYGVEKVYYQALMVTAPCLVLGGRSIAAKVHAPAWLVLPVVLVPYVGLMWKYGIIASILG